MVLLAALVLGFGALGSPVQAETAPAAVVASPTVARGWVLYGTYKCYSAACRAAKSLRDCGYPTCITCDGRYYYVHYYCS
jgi:hypothetical protein